MRRKMARAKVYCEVTCCLCGALASESGYYDNSSRISKIKKDVRNWAWDEEIGGNLCPECYKKEKGL